MSINFEWSDLDFWESGEWQVIEEKLDDLTKAGKIFNPERKALFAALDACPFQKCKVAIFGQDPYPDHALATGIAFSVPESSKKLPPTLEMIFDEYETDLHYPRPKKGNLDKWCQDGVLLWNTIPTCAMGDSLSHKGWFEWEFLSAEMVKRLAERGVVLCFLGSVAARLQTHVPSDSKSKVIVVSHPSPRGIKFSRNPFVGSRIFSTINAKLVELKLEPVNWRLE